MICNNYLEKKRWNSVLGEKRWKNVLKEKKWYKDLEKKIWTMVKRRDGIYPNIFSGCSGVARMHSKFVNFGIIWYDGSAIQHERYLYSADISLSRVRAHRMIRGRKSQRLPFCFVFYFGYFRLKKNVSDPRSINPVKPLLLLRLLIEKPNR